MKEIYFDNSATTRVCDAAREAALYAMQEEYGNPSSAHARGARAYQALNEARAVTARALGCAADEVYFTSGGTEANNTAMFGAAQMLGRSCKRVLVSAVEHASVSEAAKQLANRGLEVRLIPVDQQGVVRLDALAALLDEQTALVSVMQVNNETGTIEPLAEVGALVRQLAPQAVFHIDGVQAFCRLPIDLAGWRADAYTASGHKIHAPKGIGLLWVKKTCRLPALLYGGGQERRFRSGTENMPGILALAAAVRAAADMDGQAARLRAVKQTLVDSVTNLLPEVYVNGQPPEAAAPHIVNLSFPGARSEVLLHYLERAGVCVSAGSACDSRGSKGSQVLLNMGLAPERVDSALRFSFCRENTEAEAEAAARLLREAVDEVRLLMGKNKRRR